jgi:DNA-binding CsgD family transcriptional regulator
VGVNYVEARPDDGSSRYTRRQSQILTLAASGLTDKKIAIQLAVSVPTVRAHLQRFYRSNHVPNRAAAVALWVRLSFPVESAAPGGPRKLGQS